MKRKLPVLILEFLAFLLIIASPVFAGPFTGVGGDADYFPRDRFIGSAYVVPALYMDNTSGSLIIAAEGVIGSGDLAAFYKYGVQGSRTVAGMGLRKRIWDSENSLFGFTLIYDVDGLLAQDTSVNGAYLGGIFSKKIDNLYPYVALLSTTYYTFTGAKIAGVDKWEYIYGSGIAGGVRYDYDANWSGRIEANYNSLSPTASMPGPKTVTSLIFAASYRK